MSENDGVHSESRADSETQMMSSLDYPTLFRSSDATAIQNQTIHLRLQAVYLGSLVVGSILTALVPVVTTLKPPLLGAGAIALALGLIALLVSRAQRYAAISFDCRAIAESVKTITWRFVMRTPPFHDDSSADVTFVSQLRRIRETRPGVARHLASQLIGTGSEITKAMRDLRARPFGDRLDFYVRERLRGQRDWYYDRGRSSSRHSTRWFWTTTALQAIAVVVAISQTGAGGFRVNVVPLLTACAAAVTAWSQMERYDELAQAYTLAAQELSELEALAVAPILEKDFTPLVEQVEEAISREHTMWCARRQVLLPTVTTGRQ